MSEKWDDVFVIAGPTASGKSALAVELAKRWNAEIISADACQVYRGLPILTAQPDSVEKASIPHHLVDVLDPQLEFSAVDFARLGLVALETIRARRKSAIVVGGAGFYLETLFDGLSETPPPDEAIRARLKNLPLSALVQELHLLDPAAAGTVDLQNPRRVQRALEIVLLTGRPFSSFARQPDHSVRGIVLDLPRESLNQRIERRVDSMLQNGAIAEVRALGPCSSTCGKCIGVAEVLALLAGSISFSQCRERMAIATRQYAKRQRTWFRHRARWDFVAPEIALESVLTRLKI